MKHKRNLKEQPELFDILCNPKVSNSEAKSNKLAQRARDKALTKKRKERLKIEALKTQNEEDKQFMKNYRNKADRQYIIAENLKDAKQANALPLNI